MGLLSLVPTLGVGSRGIKTDRRDAQMLSEERARDTFALERRVCVGDSGGRRRGSVWASGGKWAAPCAYDFVVRVRGYAVVMAAGET